MSKKQFVELYLSAMLKAATGRRVYLSYANFDLAHEEIVRIEDKRDNGAAICEIPVSKLGLLEIAVAVIEKVRGMQK